MVEFLKHIGSYDIHQMGESATACISALRARLTMLKKRQGQAIPLFFSYVKQTRKTKLKAAQLRFLG
jgi:predicted transcriptional regulator